MDYIAPFKNFPKRVPPIISIFSDHIYDIINKKFDQWFGRKALANYRDEILINYKDVGVPPDQFKATPIETIRIVFRFKVVSESDHQESGVTHEISDKVSDVGTKSYRQKSFSGISDHSYHMEIEANFSFNKHVGSYDILAFKKSMNNFIIHEMSHVYESIQNHQLGGGLTSPSSIIMDLFDDKVQDMTIKNSHGSTLIYNFFHLIYLTTSEEIYANILASSAFDNVNDFKNSKEYRSVIYDLKNFNFRSFLKNLKMEIGEEKIDGYNIPEDLPELFGNFYLECKENIENINKGRKINHDRYIRISKLEVMEFLIFWENEFHKAAEYIEEKSIEIINNK